MRPLLTFAMAISILVTASTFFSVTGIKIRTFPTTNDSKTEEEEEEEKRLIINFQKHQILFDSIDKNKKSWILERDWTNRDNPSNNPQ